MRRRIETVLVHSYDHSLGDGLLQVPFFRALRGRLPAARVTLAISLGGSTFTGPFARATRPLVDEILTDAHLHDGPRWPFARAPRPLGGRRFDLVIDLHKEWRWTLSLRRVRHRLFVSASRHWAFSDRAPYRWSKPERVSDQHLMLVHALRLPEVAPVPAIEWFSETEAHEAARLLPPGPPAIGFVPGAGDRRKCWPLDRFVALARAQAMAGRRPVFLLGPQEAEWASALRDAVPGAVLSGFAGPGGGPAPLPVVVALGARLTAAVSNDCGTAHLLALTGTPLVSIFGGTNVKKYRPATPHLAVVEAASFDPARRLDCVPVDAVAAALETLLADAGPRRRAASDPPEDSATHPVGLHQPA